MCALESLWFFPTRTTNGWETPDALLRGAIRLLRGAILSVLRYKMHGSAVQYCLFPTVHLGLRDRPPPTARSRSSGWTLRKRRPRTAKQRVLLRSSLSFVPVLRLPPVACVVYSCHILKYRLTANSLESQAVSYNVNNRFSILLNIWTENLVHSASVRIFAHVIYVSKQEESGKKLDFPCSLFVVFGHNTWIRYVFDGDYAVDRTVQAGRRGCAW